MKKNKKKKQITLMLISYLLMISAANASYSVLIVAADGSPPTSELMVTGKFSTVDYFDARTDTPSLATLSSYDSVLAYTNYQPDDAIALGDVLADYVDGGGRLALSTYSFSSDWDVRGRIVTPGYSPLTNLGTNGDVSGNLVVTTPDPIFDGVNISGVSYFHNSNFAHPGLDVGATLLATDGSGINMIAINSTRQVVSLNFFPAPYAGNNEEVYKLIGNSLVPEPCTIALLGLGAASLLKRKRVISS